MLSMHRESRQQSGPTGQALLMRGPGSLLGGEITRKVEHVGGSWFSRGYQAFRESHLVI